MSCLCLNNNNASRTCISTSVRNCLYPIHILSCCWSLITSFRDGTEEYNTFNLLNRIVYLKEGHSNWRRSWKIKYINSRGFFSIYTVWKISWQPVWWLTLLTGNILDFHLERLLPSDGKLALPYNIIRCNIQPKRKTKFRDLIGQEVYRWEQNSSKNREGTNRARVFHIKQDSSSYT